MRQIVTKRAKVTKNVSERCYASPIPAIGLELIIWTTRTKPKPVHKQNFTAKYLVSSYVQDVSMMLLHAGWPCSTQRCKNFAANCMMQLAARTHAFKDNNLIPRCLPQASCS